MLYGIAGTKTISKAVIVFTTVVLLLVLSACGTSGVQNSSTDLKESGERAPVTAALSEPSSQKIDESVAATTELAEREETMKEYDFSAFTNVEITGIDLDSLSADALAVLYAQARYCQAMTDADIDAMRELVSEDMIFTHMSGMQQTREEYFADVADGSLNYFTIGIENPVIEVNGDKAQITYTAVLNANAYGARGTYRMKCTHHYERNGSQWIAVNG